MIERGLLNNRGSEQQTSTSAEGGSATGTETSKLNKLLQTPTINKVDYMENYKLMCSSSNSASIKSNQKSVIRKGPNSVSGTEPQ